MKFVTNQKVCSENPQRAPSRTVLKKKISEIPFPFRNEYRIYILSGFSHRKFSSITQSPEIPQGNYCNDFSSDLLQEFLIHFLRNFSRYTN